MCRIPPALCSRASTRRCISTLKLSGQRLTLPINALLFRPEGTMAAVVGPDGKLLLKKLTIGRDLGNSVEVLDGITQSDAIVINPPDSLETGQQVNITSSDTQSPPASQPNKQ